MMIIADTTQWNHYSSLISLPFTRLNNPPLFQTTATEIPSDFATKTLEPAKDSATNDLKWYSTRLRCPYTERRKCQVHEKFELDVPRYN